MTLGRTLAVGAVLLAGLTVAVDLATFDRKAWQSDYARLKLGMAQGYANLDWQVDHRGLDLARLDRETSARLAGAYSHIQTYRAMRDFIAAFRDPHLSLSFGEAPDSARAYPLASNAGGSSRPSASCDAYEEEDLATGLAYPSTPGWRHLGSRNFPAGIIGETGFLRIAEFGERKYREACDAVKAQGMDDRALQLATRARLNAELKTQLIRLRTAGAGRLVIDVTGNGGGSEWATEAAAMFGQGGMSRRRPALANPRCDRSAIWTGKSVCSVYGDAPETDRMTGENLWDGPIVLFGDEHSASATEEFIVWLKDSGRASFAGRTTLGAGCGYIDGGHAVGFKAASLHVMMPNCSRFTRDGTNEIEGIAPDVDVNWPEVKPGDYPVLLDRLFARKTATVEGGRASAESQRQRRSAG